jgi:hypothetical protein
MRRWRAWLHQTVILWAVLFSLLERESLGSDPIKRGQDMKELKLKITIEDKVITATLEDNASARDFASLLPLDLTLEDYNSTEKISDLPGKLSTTGAPDGIDPAIGDICYYAPWGNLALFYKDFGYSKGLVRLGKIDSGLETLDVTGSLKARIELIK